MSGCPLEQLLRPGFQIEARILVGLVARNRGDSLHKVEDAFRLAAFFREHRLDDLGCFGLAEPALPQEFGSILVSARNDPLSRCLDAVEEGRGRGVGKTSQRWGGLMGEA